MTSLLDKASGWLKDRFDEGTSVPVTLIAGTRAIEDVAAVPGQRRHDELTVEQYAISSATFDWIVRRADLVIDSEERLPDSDWQVRRLLPDGRTAVYVATAPFGSRHWSPVDPLGQLIRIHTVLDRTVIDP